MTFRPDENSALARLFVGRGRVRAARTLDLPGGQVLIKAGEAANCLYYLTAGRLGAMRYEQGQEPQLLGVIRPGEPAGEMSMIAETPHTASVVALRDSELVALSRDDFFKAVRKRPEVMAELARLMIHRARHGVGTVGGEPTAFGLLAITEGVDVRGLAESVCREVAAMGLKATVVGPEGMAAPAEWFTNVEAAHDVVLYAAEYAEQAWKQVIGRQVDRIFRIGAAEMEPPTLQSFVSQPLQDQRQIDLVLNHSRRAHRPHNRGAWLTKDLGNRLFHLRLGDRADIQRMARIVTGRSVGLVLSGGGARAYAHIGAIQVLREAGVPIDFLGGASMGAMIAAGVALGWGHEEMDERIRHAFVDSSPLDDISFPMIAMTRGAKVAERLEENFGDIQMPDMWLPYFAVSSDLTAGAYKVHRRGLLRHALRASISLPGVLPPVIEDGHVLVDGAVISNFPSDIMRAQHAGVVIGVDVTRSRGMTAEDIAMPHSLWRWFWSGDWRRGPPIVSLLMRAATVHSASDAAAAREAVDLLITPKTAHIEIRNWKAYDPAVAAGREAAGEALAGLHGAPVTELRLRAAPSRIAVETA
ncbi:MAG: patatin-like phospholipase family protein [Caulobacteraceae bacterium]